MSNEHSCIGCKFLYARERGYSNYTVEDTEISCAKDRNPNLSASEPCDWNMKDDNWPNTNASRCELYAAGEWITLDVDGEYSVDRQSNDPEQIASIRAHSGQK